jgi:hypothetical protein
MQALEPNLVAAELHFGAAARSEAAWLPRLKFSGFRRGTARFPCRARRLPCRWRTRATGEMAGTPIRSRCTGRRFPDGIPRRSNRYIRNQPRAVWFRSCVPHPASLRRSRMNRLGKIFCSYHLRRLIGTNVFVAICCLICSNDKGLKSFGSTPMSICRFCRPPAGARGIARTGLRSRSGFCARTSWRSEQSVIPWSKSGVIERRLAL